MTLLGAAAKLKAKPEEARTWAERAVQAAEPYGERWRRDILLAVSEILLDQEGLAAEHYRSPGRRRSCSARKTPFR